MFYQTVGTVERLSWQTDCNLSAEELNFTG